MAADGEPAPGVTVRVMAGQDMTQAERAAPAASPAFPDPHRLRIAPLSQEVGRARHWFRDCLNAWPPDGWAAAEAVFAEVAANAVRHGRGPVTVTVRVSGEAVRCAIRDGSWRVPRVLAGWAGDREDGRGMLIITALAADWGVRRHLLGKTVWFEVRVPEVTVR
jgi:anti-sigma regulatory factor (Ser/Thr protein kinase)